MSVVAVGTARYVPWLMWRYGIHIDPKILIYGSTLGLLHINPKPLQRIPEAHLKDPQVIETAMYQLYGSPFEAHVSTIKPRGPCCELRRMTLSGCKVVRGCCFYIWLSYGLLYDGSDFNTGPT